MYRAGISAVSGAIYRERQKGVAVLLRGHTYMTSALRGGRGVVQNVTIVLIGCVNGTVTRGEGVQKSENFADVI